MGKIIITLIIVMAFILALVVAPEILIDREDKTIELDPDNKTILDRYNITPDSYYDSKTENGDEYYRCLVINGTGEYPPRELCSERFTAYEIVCTSWNLTQVINGEVDFSVITSLENLPNINRVECLVEERIDMTDEEIGLDLDLWEEQRLIQIANSQDERERRVSDDRVREGNISISTRG